MFKEIDIESGQFEANGTKYFIVPERISPYRFPYWQQMSLEMSFNTDFKQLYKSMQTIFNLSTSGNDFIGNNHKIATESYNAMSAVGNIQREQDKYLTFCALFINAEGEDVARWDDELINKKVNDWKSEPFDMNVFFSLAMSQVPGLIEKYNSTLSQEFQQMRPVKVDS